MSDNQNSGIIFWSIFLIIAIIAIVGLIIFIILFLTKKNAKTGTTDFILNVTNNNELTISWNKNDSRLQNTDLITIYITSTSPQINNNIVVNPGVISNNSVNAKQIGSIILNNLNSFQNTQVYVTTMITNTGNNIGNSNIYLVYMSITPPASDISFQIEPVGVDGKLDFLTNEYIYPPSPTNINLVSSSSPIGNNYFTYNNTFGEGTGTYPYQLVSIVNSEGNDMGPWVLMRNGSYLDAIPRRNVTDNNVKDTQWTYINNQWCLMSDTTWCIRANNVANLPSIVTVEKLNADPNTIEQKYIPLGQRWKNIIG